jgi:hypothetical protein
MKVSMENKKKEAIARMKALGIYPDSIKSFEKGIVSCSEPPFGANYWLNDDQHAIVKEFEETYNALVYFAVRSYTNFGTLDSFLYVSDYEEEYGLDNHALKQGYVYAYVHNYDVPEYSEIGMIGVRESFGGLIRIS